MNVDQVADDLKLLGERHETALSKVRQYETQAEVHRSRISDLERQNTIFAGTISDLVRQNAELRTLLGSAATLIVEGMKKHQVVNDAASAINSAIAETVE